MKRYIVFKYFINVKRIGAPIELIAILCCSALLVKGAVYLNYPASLTRRNNGQVRSQTFPGSDEKDDKSHEVYHLDQYMSLKWWNGVHFQTNWLCRYTCEYKIYGRSSTTLLERTVQK